MTPHPLLVTASFSKSPRVSWYMWVIGFLTRRRAGFDAPNMASVASTNKRLHCLIGPTDKWRKRWPIYFLSLHFCSHYCSSARMARHRRRLRSHCWFSFAFFFKQKSWFTFIFWIRIWMILLLMEVHFSQAWNWNSELEIGTKTRGDEVVSGCTRKFIISELHIYFIFKFIVFC